ncbi:hypothetical protein HN958_01465 [Candidatus Falkowbacteria bacterium]|jgi:XTP/dITP diphosphohydrolase|nr:hypothetical protein [Candidatus Falkowbacteria bacterium]MBT7007154.1 hypothetical protein [Candidatus Falkowbacteria bacterium]
MSKTIYFVTTNKEKIKQASKSLSRFNIELKDVNLEMPESRAEDSKEIAIEKAKIAFDKLKKPVIVEDSGFYIKSLGGFPMTHIKFSLKTLGIANIIKMMQGFKTRNAEWRMSVAYCSKKNNVKTFTYIDKGSISTKLKRKKRKTMSDYWRIYIPSKFNPKNLALSEFAGKDIERREEHYAANNQFMKFGKWFIKQ